MDMHTVAGSCSLLVLLHDREGVGGAFTEHSLPDPEPQVSANHAGLGLKGRAQGIHCPAACSRLGRERRIEGLEMEDKRRSKQHRSL